ncbi:hypothetical protein N7541_001907 [Penicillium brevicompactum]|uniref:DUF3074 domain-containing protein n=1 Tax=Penicillium brevicompactum TaxID=5074 RepID=A0A9W9RNV8_PENBR|nr:hypothetical protein N7541_001907 [Penicillium brevicompactum]
MSSLHEALQCLKPTSWDDVPQEPAELRKYVRDLFQHARLVAESLPDPPSSESDSYPGLDLDTDDLAFPKFAPSHTRVGETDPEITALQKEWGKPLKMGGPKDNPLDVAVWKLSANDGGGSWFGRRSVHEGLPFDQWRNKISTEYDETLKVNQKKIAKGQTPDGSIRGIGAEQKVESIEIKDDSGSVLGDLIVYHVSAQFPKPTAPRDFVAMIINSDSGLQIGGTKQPGRSWMMISKPCDHPGVPAKNGYTRGNYESVELIREIPRKSAVSSSSSSSSSQKTKKNSDSSSSGVSSSKEEKPTESDDDAINPVEWIMVTRSDPGGSIPRWMVDKGTPRSVGLDAAKFINWAVQKDKPSKKDKSPETEAINASKSDAKSGHSVNDESNSDQADDSDSDYESLESDGEHSHHGLIASVTGLLSSGLERYGPQVLGYGSNTHESQTHGGPSEGPGDAESTNHLSPGSARDKPASEVESSRSREPDLTSLASAQSDVGASVADDLAHNNMRPEELIQMTKNGKLTSHEKELAKLALRKREVEAKLEEVRAEMEKLNVSQLPTNPGTPLKGINETDSDASGLRKRAATNRSSTPSSNATPQSTQDSTEKSSQTATPDHASSHKAAAQLLSGETKLLKQLRKIEASQLKVASKIETKQRKHVERSEKSKSKSEVETLRQEVHDLKKEVRQLMSDRQKWVDLVGSLQAENSRLIDRAEK